MLLSSISVLCAYQAD